MIEKLKNIIIGLIIGTANIVPGVSAGTMFVILGIYQKIIDSFNSIMNICREGLLDIIKPKNKKQFFMAIPNMIYKMIKQENTFLIPLLIGMVIAILGLSVFFKNLNAEQLIYRKYIFLGLIIGGIMPLIKELNKDNSINSRENENENKNKDKDKKREIIIFGIIGIIFGLILLLLKENNIAFSVLKVENISNKTIIPIFLAGAIAAFSMVIPGISGSMILLILGMYDAMTEVLNGLALDFANAKFIFIIPFAIGIIIGIILAIRLIKYLLDNFYTKTYSIIIGFVISSTIIIFSGTQKMFMDEQLLLQSPKKIIIAIICFVVGIAFSYLIDKNADKISK
ncbi:MAG: DUF368 domain-containing protein [Clostridium sp.]